MERIQQALQTHLVMEEKDLDSNKLMPSKMKLSKDIKRKRLFSKPLLIYKNDTNIFNDFMKLNK